jgi:hypothetical protein
MGIQEAPVRIVCQSPIERRQRRLRSGAARLGPLATTLPHTDTHMTSAARVADS